jgi:hypothetical protein
VSKPCTVGRVIVVAPIEFEPVNLVLTKPKKSS